MKAVIIGAGFAGQVHAAALAACGVEVDAIITTREETAEAFARQWNIPRWGTDLSLAFGEDIDAVHICTPPTTHGWMVKELLNHGKNVLCEKPLSFDAEEAEEIAKTARESGRICALTFNVRYHMAVQKAKEIIQSGEFGRPLLIHGNYMQEFNAFPAPLDWRYKPQLAGTMRAVSEIGSHWIDLAQYVSGKKITAVSALFGNFHPDRILADGLMYPADSGVEGEPIHIVSEDAAALTFRYEDGAMGNVLLSEISPGRGNRLTLEITCQYGNLWWNEEDNNILYTAKKGEGVRMEVFAFGNGFTDTFRTLLTNYYGEVARRKAGQGGDGFGAAGQGEAAVQAGRQPQENWPTFEEGAQVTAVCCAAAESARQDSRWVEV